MLLFKIQTMNSEILLSYLNKCIMGKSWR